MAVVKWAVRPWDDRRILYIDELCDVSSMLPSEGDIISRPFLVDPETLEPVPVRVIEIIDHPKMHSHVVVVVAPADEYH
jgi:hypothetical protein